MIPNRADDGEEISAGGDERRAILRRDPADRDARHGHDLAPPGEQLEAWAIVRGLRRRWEEGTEGDVIGARLGRVDGEVPAVMAGDADDAIGTEQAARLIIGSILLPDMDAVAARLGGEIGPVVEQESDAAPLRYWQQNVAGAFDVVIRRVFQAELYAGDVAGVEGLRQGVA